jgi:hypothetical protein
MWSRYHWEKDDAACKINIFQAPVDTEKSALTKPSILISFGNVQSFRGDNSPGGIDTTGKGDWMNRLSFYLPVSITCVAPNEIEANTIAYYLFRGVQEFRHILLQHGAIGAISSSEGLRLAVPVGAQVPFASADWYAAVVNIVLRVDDTGQHVIRDKSGTLIAIENVLNEALQEN